MPISRRQTGFHGPAPTRAAEQGRGPTLSRTLKVLPSNHGTVKAPVVAVLIAAFLLSACDLDLSRGERFESEETVLPVVPPIQSARLNEFGFPNEDMRHEIWVRLEPGALVSEVFDMSVFEPLSPGVNQVEAKGILGDPDSQTTDGCGENWFFFKRRMGTLVVGCDHDTGFLPISTFCTWRLYVELNPDQEVVAAVIHPFIEMARSSPVSVTQRTVHIQNTDYSESVTYFFDEPDENDTAAWTNERWSTKRGFCFGE